MNALTGKKVNVLCIVDRNHERSVVVLDHLLLVEYNIENEEGILIQGKVNYLLFDIKKKEIKN